MGIGSEIMIRTDPSNSSAITGIRVDAGSCAAGATLRDSSGRAD
jgi:hypothetical protein